MINWIKFFVFLLFVIHSTDLLAATPVVSKRFVPGAQTASISGNWALWHNPAGLAFMGGSESAIAYLYEWSEQGNRHHGGANLAFNFWRSLSIAGGINSQAAFVEKAKNNLGSDLSGIFAGAFKITEYGSFGISFLKSHNFLSRRTTPFLVSFGLQIRPFSFLSFGGHYEEVHGAYFAAPNITTGISLRPYKEFFTLGIDSRFVALGEQWSNGFRTHPIFGLRTSYRGYGAAISAEIPGLSQGWAKPIFSFSLDFNFSHFGLSVASLVNSAEHNFAVGTNLRVSSEEWPSMIRSSDLWVELTIDQDGTLDKKPATFAERFFGVPDDPLSVLALLRRIENDASIGHVLLNIKGFSFGNGKTEEWREAILALRKANKEVIVYLDSPSERDYYIACAANQIHMNQNATLSLRNFQTTLIYFADLLNKIGVKAEAAVAGVYKTAPRAATHSRPQKEEIEIANNILVTFYDTMLSEVEKARQIPREKLKVLFDRGEITANDAKDALLIDKLVSPIEDVFASEEKPRYFFRNYEKRVFKQEQWHPPRKIVVIPINDTIVDGRALPGLFSLFSPVTGAQDVLDEIDDAKNDPNVVGLILRIDSPGGDALAGHRINQAVFEANKIKPIVTSMSDVAASAGYLIASGSGQILAMPNTITGSIGVFSLSFSAEELAQKIGVFSKELSPLKNPGATVFRTPSKAEREETQRIVNWVYANFISTVAANLNLDQEEVKKNADGRVWLGKEALERKLVHELGGFAQAVDNVRTLAEIDKSEDLIIEIRSPGIREQFSLSARLASIFQNKQVDVDIRSLSIIAAPYIKALDAYRLNGVPQARLPFDIEWKKHKYTAPAP